MKKSVIAIIVISALTACHDDGRDDVQEAIDNHVFNESMKEFLLIHSIESAELREFVKVAQESDPSITHAYYTEGDNGEKFINVVRDAGAQDDEPSMMETIGIPIAAGIVGGLAGAALAESLNSSGGVFSRSSGVSRFDTKKDEVRRRWGFVSAYNNGVMRKQSDLIRKNPMRMESFRKLSTSKSAFVGARSSRAGAYGGGRGG